MDSRAVLRSLAPRPKHHVFIVKRALHIVLLYLISSSAHSLLHPIPKPFSLYLYGPVVRISCGLFVASRLPKYALVELIPAIASVYVPLPVAKMLAGSVISTHVFVASGPEFACATPMGGALFQVIPVSVHVLAVVCALTPAEFEAVAKILSFADVTAPLSPVTSNFM